MPRSSGRVIHRPEFVGIKRNKPRALPSSRTATVVKTSIDCVLIGMLALVRREMGWRDEEARIPPSKRISKRERRQQRIPNPRMELTPSEASLMGLVLMHHWDMDAVVATLAAPQGLRSADVMATMRSLMKKPALAEAFVRWRKHHRLPRHLSWRWRHDWEALDSQYSWRRVGSWYRFEPNLPLAHVRDLTDGSEVGLAWVLQEGDRVLKYRLAVASDGASGMPDLFHEGGGWRLLGADDRWPLMKRSEGHIWRIAGIEGRVLSARAARKSGWLEVKLLREPEPQTCLPMLARQA